MGNLIKKLKEKGLVRTDKLSDLDLFDLDLKNPEDYVFLLTERLLDKLHDLMVAKGINQTDLAKILNVSKQSVSKSLSGNGISMEWILKAIVLLGGVIDLRMLVPEKDPTDKDLGFRFQCTSISPISQNFKTLREQAGLSVSKLASKVHVSKNEIEKIEDEHVAPSSAVSRKMAELYGIPKHFLKAD